MSCARVVVEAVSSILKAIAANVRLHRDRRGWTQAQLAEAAGLDIRQVQRIEDGRVNFGVTSLVTVATALGVSVAALVADRPLRRRGRGRPRKTGPLAATAQPLRVAEPVGSLARAPRKGAQPTSKRS